MRVESAVGVRLAGEGIGFGKIESINNESLTGQVYFEIHPDQLRGSGKISVELYGDVGFGLSDCAKHGTLLSHAKFASIADEIDMWGDEPNKVFSSSTFRFNSYNSMFRDLNVDCHPRASGAVMAAAEYTIFDPFNQTSIWFPDSETSTKGRLDYCIRIRVNQPNIRRLGPPDLFEAKAAAAASKVSNGEEQDETIETDKGYDTSFDTKIRIEGDRSKRGFQSDSSEEDKEVASTHSSQAVESSTKSDDFQKISAFAFSCSDGGKGKYNDYGTVVPPSMEFGDARRRFAVGQVFRVCVSPGEGFEEVYSVVSFESVVCENFGEARRLFQNFKPTDDSMERDNAALTSSTRNTMSYVNLDTAEIVTASNTLSFRTMVTPDFRKLNETSFVCSGVVSLRYQPPSGYNTTNSTLMQATQKTIRSDFSISIDLLTPRHVNAKSIEDELRPKKWKLGLILFSIFWIMFLVLLDYSLHGTDHWNYAYEQVLSGNFCFCRWDHSDHESDDDDGNRWSYMYHQILSGNFCCHRGHNSDNERQDDDDNCFNYQQILSGGCFCYRRKDDNDKDDHHREHQRHRQSQLRHRHHRHHHNNDRRHGHSKHRHRDRRKGHSKHRKHERRKKEGMEGETVDRSETTPLQSEVECADGLP